MIVSVPDIDRRPSGAAAWRRGLTLAALALGLGLAACASVEPPAAPAKSEPTAAEQRPITPPASPERKRLIDAFGGEYRAPATESYLNGVLAKLAQASDAANQPYRVTLLDSPVVNAFALPSGDIFMTRGLLALADDTSEIAAVMAHEIAHVTARHAAQRAEFAKTAALFARVNQKVLDRSQAPDEAEARSRLSIASFSREQEFEADQIGIKSVARAGYDPYGAARFLTALGEWSALSSSTSQRSADRPDMMATHPSTPERIAQAEVEARNLAPPGGGVTARDAYLAAIDGLLFGDDPSQGVVRGTLFIHPKLGFAFEAPAGFTLENQSAALIGVGDGGAEALRLDSIPISDSTSVASAIASDWIDGVKTTDVEIAADRRPRRGDRDGARERVELPARRGASQRPALPPDLCRPVALAGRRSALPRVAAILSPDQRAQFGAGRVRDDQDRHRRRRRHARHDGRADDVPAGAARPVPDPERARARRAAGPRATLQAGGSMTADAPGPSRRRLPARIVAATHNAGKLREIRELLAPHGVDAVGAAELNLAEPEETGATFRDNAAIKAEAAARAAGEPALADNSGLCVEALGGAPGVYSARWAGGSKDFAAAMARIERELLAAGAAKPWRAYFVSALALGWPDGRTETFEGRVDGDLVFPPRGTAGFGYDPDLQAGRP